METTTEKYGAILRDTRLKAKLSQAELASRIGKSQQAVNRWEYGHSMPRPKTRNELMRVLPGLRRALSGGKPGEDEPDEGSKALDGKIDISDSRFLRANPFLAKQLHDRTMTTNQMVQNLIEGHPLVQEKPFSEGLNTVIENKVGNAVTALYDLEMLFDSLQRECTI